MINIIYIKTMNDANLVKYFNVQRVASKYYYFYEKLNVIRVGEIVSERDRTDKEWLYINYLRRYV